ncbi:MAG: hypothetical protein LJE61_14165 [Thiocapsa sp.]|nr:hypothetical protein [Thiocapsa sp.]MCG6986333.1 hypothetical protein [Thiocapsa sp.]
MKNDGYEHKDCWSRTPHFRPGTKLTAEQLNASQADAVRRDRLVNVAMHGIGVAYGFQIRADAKGRLIVEDGCIYVTCGLAFDRYGRMLFWGGGHLAMKDIIGPKPHTEGRYTLSVHYAEKSDQNGAFDPCREGAEWLDRCVVFTLTESCKPHDGCAPDVPLDACMTRTEWICTRSGFQPGTVPKDEALAYACAEPPPLVASDCGRVSYDPEAGIPLSCVEICDLDRDKEDCYPRYDFCHCGDVDNCRFRPVAYRSPLLYELINLDDVPLAKIASYSWSEWELQEWSDEDRVPFSAFKHRAKACQSWPIKPWDGFAIMFTRPVQRRTLHPLSVIMDIFILETRANYWEPWRIPTRILHLDEAGEIISPESEADCAWGALICPEDDWIKYEVDDAKSTILDCANIGRLARVEISIRGQIVRDCCGLMIDARPIDVDEGDPCLNRPGQERPGDTWISIFRIGRDAYEQAQAPSDQQEGKAEIQAARQADSSIDRSEI